MKRRLLSLLATGALAISASAQSYYSTDFSQEEEFNKWTVFDNNNDGVTWVYDADGSQSKVYYAYTASNTADDWLISPAITPTAAGKVLVTYTTYGTYYGEDLDVYTGGTATIEGMTTKQASYTGIKGTPTTGSFITEVKAGEPLHVGFHCLSGADHWKFYICSFSVKGIEKAIDLKADSLLSPNSGKNLGDETVTVRVKNDGSDPAEGFDVAFTVDGGEPVTEHVDATLGAGESMEYTFTAKASLKEPRHKYVIKAYPTSKYEIVPENDTITASVRNCAPLDPPYTMGFEASEDRDEIKFYNLNGDGGDWSVYTSMWMNMARTGNSCLAYNYDKDNNANDWAILDGINVEAGDYVLRYWYSGSTGHKERLGVYWGNGDTPDDMKNKIEDKDPITQGEYLESFKIVHFDAPQTIYLGFYAFSDKDENWLTIDDVQFYKASSDAVDLVVSTVSAPYDYVRTPNDKDVTFDVTNVGIKDTKATVTVKVDGEQKWSNEQSIAAQEIKTLTASGAIEGLSAGKHTLTVEIASDDDTDSTNNTVEKEITVLGTPTVMYDFEDGKIPESFSFYTGDEGTLNADAGDEFNDYGWGIIDVQAHRMYGEHVLAGASWVDNVSKVDRWIILPQVTLGEGDSYLAWDASSGNATYLESYKVKVSDGSGDPADWWYSTSLEVNDESIYPKTRGISLSKYAGKNVYIAFNIVSKPADFLVLDNIGLYGAAGLVSGISDMTVAPAEISVSSAEISAPQAQSIAVVDLGGRTMLRTAGSSLATQSLQPGVYVATVKTATGTHSVRFVKK